MVPVVQNFAQDLVNYWQNQIDEQGPKATLEIHEDVNRVALDAICKCAFDYDTNALEDQNNEVTTAFAKVLSLNLG